MFFKEIPFLRIFIPYCAGIAVSLCTNISINVIIFLLGVFSILLLANSFTVKPYHNTAFGILFIAVLFLSGILLSTHERKSLSTLEQKEQLFYAVILDFPEEKENSCMIKSKLKYILRDSSAVRIKGSMVLYYSKDTPGYRLMPGDMIIFRATPLEIRNRGNPCEFDYRFYMESRGFRYYGFVRNDDILYCRQPSKRTLREKAIIFREKIISMYSKRGSGGRSLALAAAITLGEKSILEEDEKEHFARAGVMHIMAVSGLHAGILSMFIFNILFFLKKKLKFLRILVTLAILWLFAFTAGLSPSVVRASLMFSFLHTGRLLNRKINPVNSLLASAFTLSVISPHVIFDPAFQLSYTAVLFIILFYRNLYNILNFNYYIPDKIWQLISVTFAAQAGTLPLTLAMFNRFPLLFLLSNIFIVPLAAIVIISGFMSVITAPAGIISSFFVTVMDRASFLAGYLTEKASMFPFSSLENTGITQPECFFLTLFMAIFLYYLFSGRKRNAVFPLAALLLLLIATTSKKVISGLSNELIVYNIRTITAAGIRNGNTLNLFYRGDKVPAEALRHCAIMGLRLTPTEISGKMPFMIKAGDKKIIISDNFLPGIAEKEDAIFIITGSKPSLPVRVMPEYIVFTSAYPGIDDRNRIINQGKTVIWFVKREGCFRIKIK